MPFASRRGVLSLQNHFSNEEMGLMLMKLDKQSMSEQADERARALLNYAWELEWRRSRTSFLSAMLVFILAGAALGAWNGGFVRPHDVWDVLLMIGNGLGGGFGGFMLFYFLQIGLGWLSVRLRFAK